MLHIQLIAVADKHYLHCSPYKFLGSYLIIIHLSLVYYTEHLLSYHFTQS